MKKNKYVKRHNALVKDYKEMRQDTYNLADWKNRIFLVFVHILLLGGVPLLMLGSFMFYLNESYVQAAIEAGLALFWMVIIFSKRLALREKKYYIIVTLYGLGVFVLVNTGPAGAGFITINFPLVLSGCMLEKKQTRNIVLINILMFAILSILLPLGLLDAYEIALYKGVWLINVMATQVTGIGLIVLMYVIYMGLDNQNSKIKASKHALQANEVKYKDMMTNIFDIITILDAQGVIVYKSPNVKTILGWDSAVMLGKNFSDYIHPDDKVVAMDVIKEMLENPDQKIMRELRLRKACGAYVYIEITGTNLLDHPSIQGILANYRDITAQKKSEQALLDAKNDAEAATYAKGQFLSVMSHEIRTPLNGIMGMLQLMEMTKLTEEQSNYLSISTSASNHLLTLINDILDYSKIDAHKIELEHTDIYIDDLVVEMKNLFVCQVDANALEWLYTVDEAIPRILRGDGHRLKQILFNLLSNAIKFTQAGQVQLSVTLVEDHKDYATLKWSIKDTGIGLSDDQVKHIFEIFHQGESSITRRYGGTGLGLSISKALVELMGGKIWVESSKDIGSEFSFTCHLAKVEKIPAGDGYENIEGSVKKHKQNLKVLIAEDDDFSRFLLEKLGENLQWQMTLVENGQLAVEAFENQNFDMILMDVSMPVLGGLEATALIRKKDAQIPIIAVSAFALTGDGQKCIDQGMNDFISKPVDMKALEAVVYKWTR